MGKTSFQTIDELVKNITTNITKLNNGQLKNSEIEALTATSQELYERLVIVRHKAYEKFGQPETVINKSVIEKSIADDSIFDLTKSEPETIEANTTDDMMFDFTEPINEEIESKIVKPLETTINSHIKETKSLNEIMSDSSGSLNDTFSSSNSLADKLKQSKITDLKQHIGINNKFSFISGLFGGSNENYNASIEKLNSCPDAEQAREILSQLSTAHQWDVENKTVISFVDIVERRYI